MRERKEARCRYGGVVLAFYSERLSVEIAPGREGEALVLGASEAELMAQIAQGNQNAFALLCGRHLKPIIAVSSRILGNAAEADEIGQETFLRLWRYAAGWDPEGTGSVRTWLSRVATNLCLDRLRRRRFSPLDEADEVEDPAPGVFEELKAEERKKVVQALLLRLPERQRIAIVLSYFEGMSGQEIAESMDVTVGAVESLLVRGRDGLRKAMKEQGLVWGKDL